MKSEIWPVMLRFWRTTHILGNALGTVNDQYLLYRILNISGVGLVLPFVYKVLCSNLSS